MIAEVKKKWSQSMVLTDESSVVVEKEATDGFDSLKSLEVGQQKIKRGFQGGSFNLYLCTVGERRE